MAAPSVIAHRGASAYAPENTLAAFQLAAKMGAAYIETDLRCTSDGRFVLLHDSRLKRTTDGTGRIVQIDFATARQLDAGSWFSPEFSGARLPTLEEGLALAEELGVGLYLELKTSLDASLRSTLLEKLRRSILDRVTLLSFRPGVLHAMQTAEPRLKTALLFRRASPVIETATRFGIRLLAPHRRRATARLVESAHRAGLGVVTWTINSRRGLAKMIAMGVDGIMTDRPDRLIEVMRSSHSAVIPPLLGGPQERWVTQR